MDALPVPVILPFNHLELQDFVLRERLERALATPSFKLRNALSEIRDHAHNLMDTLPRLVNLRDKAVYSRQGGRGCCDAFNNDGSLPHEKLRQRSCKYQRI